MAEPNKVARTTRVVSHAEAHEIMSRFNNSHFHRDNGECARYSIPANPERDDDLLMAAYIEQQEAAARANAELHEQRRRELADAEQAGFERGRRDALRRDHG